MDRWGLRWYSTPLRPSTAAGRPRGCPLYPRGGGKTDASPFCEGPRVAGSIGTTLGRGVTVARSALDRLVQVRILAAQLSSATVRPDAVAVRADDFAFGDLSANIYKPLAIPAIAADGEELLRRVHVIEIHHKRWVPQAAIGTGPRFRLLKHPSHHRSVLCIPGCCPGAILIRMPLVMLSLVHAAAIDAVSLKTVSVCSISGKCMARLLQPAGRASFHAQERRTWG